MFDNNQSYNNGGMNSSRLSSRGTSLQKRQELFNQMKDEKIKAAKE